MTKAIGLYPVQTCGYQQSSTTHTSFAWACSNVTLGNGLIVVMGLTGNPGASSCADSLTSSFTTATTTSETGGYLLYCSAKSIATGGADTITVTTTNSVYSTAFWMEVAGQNTTTFFDVFAGNNVASSTTWTGASITTTAANDLVVMWGFNGSTNNTFANNSGVIPFTGPVSCGIGGTGRCGFGSGGSQSGVIQYQQATTATSYTPVITVGSAMTGITGSIAFKAAPPTSITNQFPRIM